MGGLTVHRDCRCTEVTHGRPASTAAQVGIHGKDNPHAQPTRRNGQEVAERGGEKTKQQNIQ
jgi:hypothetical protein